jgi:uncharacterized membrane protein YraQ (UPF0718 family)
MRSGFTDPSTYVLAGLMQVLIPQEVVSRYFGQQAGLRALVALFYSE